MKYTNLLRLLFAVLLLTALSATNLQAVEKVTYFHFDAGGSPVAASDAAGALLWKEDYKPYGERLRNSDDGSNIQWFSGKPQDTDTGLSYYGARYYSPEIGRFMGVDPALFNESNLHSFNRYAYANNNPYRYTDPDGESPLDLIFLAVDSARLASAIASGVGIQAAALDFGASLVGVISPVPGTGQVIKATRVASKSGKVLGAVAKGVGPKAGSVGGEGAKKAFSNNVKDQARKESNDTCVFCGTKTTREPGPTRSEIDHSIPKSRGGNNTIENAQNTCRTCNRSKGAKTTDEFLNR